ncbi:MAG: FMN-binding protein [Clostridia bacterium]|nr:FMN-binding protein [Clostridia bacterium]
MQENKKGNVGFSAVSLLLISGFIACLVALVNSITAPVIAEHGVESLKENIALIFAGSEDFDDITGTVTETSGVEAIYKVKSATGGEDNYCVHTSTAGYGGAVELLVGFNCDGQIAGVAVLSADSETPGVGQKITEKQFLNGFKGLSYNDEGAKVDGVTGATVSSKAALSGVNSACVAIDKILNGEEEEVSA